jgi:hypothetical protein
MSDPVSDKSDRIKFPMKRWQVGADLGSGRVRIDQHRPVVGTSCTRFIVWLLPKIGSST